MNEEIKSRTKVKDLAEDNISPFHVEPESYPEGKPISDVQGIIDKARDRTNPITQVSAKIRLDEKTALFKLIKSKGCDGLTSFLRLLAKAERVEITL